MWTCQSQTQQSTGLFLLGRNAHLTGMKWSQSYSLKQQEALQVSPNCPPLQFNSDLEEQTNLCTHRVPELLEEAAGRVHWIQSKTERFQTQVLKHYQQKTTLAQQQPLSANTSSLPIATMPNTLRKFIQEKSYSRSWHPPLTQVLCYSSMSILTSPACVYGQCMAMSFLQPET